MSSYSLIASEYYDVDHHPTCANFDQLSRRFLEPRVEDFLFTGSRNLEVGTGRSAMAPVAFRTFGDTRSCVLLDASRCMLGHSADWQKSGAHLIVGDAGSLPFSPNTFDLLTSSLGDPYNHPGFWSEAHRVLKKGAMCLFTTPSADWASRFRTSKGRGEAEFVLSDGTSICVPSFVPTLAQQIKMIEMAGFSLTEVKAFYVSDILGRVSSKLLFPVEDDRETSVVTGFAARK